MFIQRKDTTFNYDENGDIVSVNNKGTAAITCAWPNLQYSGQEEVEETHADYQAFLLIPRIAEIRAIRNRKLDEIDVKYCNAQKWSAMSQTEKDGWVAIKTALVAITDKDANGAYITLNSKTVIDSYLDGSPNVWPW